MAKQKYINFIIQITIFISLFSSCEALDDIFYSGDVTFSISNTYRAGDVIDTVFDVRNLEEFPISDAYLVIDIVSASGNPVYPSQYSDSENVIYEEIIPAINLDSLSGKTIPYTYEIPSDLKSGTYRMDVYLRTEKTPIVGIPHIHLVSRYASFNVEGKGAGTEPSIKILRTKTNIEGITGPVGAPVDPSSKVEGEVFIQSSSTEKESLTLEVSVCRWDDTTVENCIIETKYPITINALETKSVPISFDAPSEPDAYSVRLEVKNMAGITKSLYRSRLIVQGENSKIRKLYADSKYYPLGSRVTVNTLLSGSPDHYTNPEIDDARLMMTLKDKRSGATLFEKENPLPVFSKDHVLEEISYSFPTPSVLDDFEVCARILSTSGKTYDSYCVSYKSSEFISDIRKYSLDNIAYDEQSSILSCELCIKDPSDMPQSANMFIDISDSNRREISSEELSIDSCHTLTFNADRDSVYTITLLDLDTKIQKIVNIIPSDYISSGAEEEPQDPQFESLLIPIIAVLIIVIVISLWLKRSGKNE